MVVGLSCSDDFVVMVAASDNAVCDVRFFVLEGGKTLEKCPYAKKFIKHMTPFEAGFNFTRVLWDFCKEHDAARIGLNTKDAVISGDNIPLVAADAESIEEAVGRLWGAVDWNKRAIKRVGEDSPFGVLAYYFDSLRRGKHEIGGAPFTLDNPLDRLEPVLAVLHAIVAGPLWEEKEAKRQNIEVLDACVRRLKKEISEVEQRSDAGDFYLLSRWGDHNPSSKAGMLQQLNQRLADAEQDLANAK
jgi:hypothetical protein